MRITAWSSLKKGFDTFTANLPVMMMAWISVYALQRVLDLLIPEAWPFLSLLAMLFIVSPLYAGLHYIALQAVRGESPTFRDLFVGVPQWGRILGAYILMILAVGLGTVLLIVPGIVFALMFSFAMIRFVDPALGNRRIRSSEALRESRELTLGYRWTLLGIGFLMMLPGIVVATISTFSLLQPSFPIWILELVVLLSGALFIGPVSTASYMVVYNVASRSEIRENVAEMEADADSGSYSADSGSSSER